ncbi:MAG: type II toxin-antitoxin system VapC family toxin [Phycisphaeraceae bacterium]
MKIVIDASAVLAVLADEPEADQIVAATKDAELLAPPSLHWEIGNSLTGMFKQRRITAVDADSLLDGYFRIAIRFVDVDLRAAVQLAANLKIYAYDAYMLQCAIQVGAPLLTLDQPPIRHATAIGIAIKEFS